MVDGYSCLKLPGFASSCLLSTELKWSRLQPCIIPCMAFHNISLAPSWIKILDDKRLTKMIWNDKFIFLWSKIPESEIWTNVQMWNTENEKRIRLVLNCREYFAMKSSSGLQQFLAVESHFGQFFIDTAI